MPGSARIPLERWGGRTPYMIFKNMEVLKVSAVESVVKVGDTVSDIREGKNAGVRTIGVVEGSSEMGMTCKEYEALTEEARLVEIERVENIYRKAGADHVILNLGRTARYPIISHFDRVIFQNDPVEMGKILKFL